MIKKLPLILMLINAFLAPDRVSFGARVCGATVRLNEQGAGAQKQATSRTPRLFTSTHVQVQIAGYWWPDTLPLLLGPQVQNLPANRGDKWLAILCKVTPKGTQELKSEDTIKLFFEGRQVSPFGTVLMAGQALVLIGPVSTEETLQLVFSVPARASTQGLRLSVLGSRPAPLTNFGSADSDEVESVGPEPGNEADVEQTYRDCIAALQSLYDTGLKTKAELDEGLEKLDTMMKSGDMSGLQSLSAQTDRANRDFAMSKDAYLVQKTKLQKLTRSKDLKTRRQALNASGRLQIQERKLAKGQRPTGI